jgi:DNA (cytosine-5)-methyltransferase 1
MAIPVIDLFAGPGGLGEGFSSLIDEEHGRYFKIKLSIEKDPSAHETLRFRSFFRQFLPEDAPDEYYNILRTRNWKGRKELIDSLSDAFPEQWSNAENEAWLFELPYPEEFDKKGKKKGGYTDKEIDERHDEIDTRIRRALDGENNFLLIGGPPCQAYSLAGRSRNQGLSDSDHRVHLYKEYLRIIAVHHPAVFVMENVKGLLSAEVEGNKIFDLIKSDLSNPESVYPGFGCPEYRIFSFTTEPESFDILGNPKYKSDTDYLIKAEKYGIPQTRHRVILLGVREDLQHPGKYLQEDDILNLESVIGQLPPLRSGVNRTFIGYHPKEKDSQGNPKRLYQNLKDSANKWAEVINSLVNRLREWGDLPLNGVADGAIEFNNNRGGEFLECQNTLNVNHRLANWYLDERLNGLVNHESRSHLTQDLMRYMFAGLFVEKNGFFPRLKHYAEHHEDLMPDHANAETGKHVDRFRVQLGNRPASTITSHISKDGHYFIHYDPKQCRSLTVREAARIQTFPDNYLFCGSRTSQYQQVGNAVPPYLAKQIGEIVRDILE